MILASEKQIKSYTALGCWGKRTLVQDFAENAKLSPDQTALVDPLNKETLLGVSPHRISYEELARAVDNTASALMAEGIVKDQIVLVQLPNCWELAMLYLAIAKAGAVISPVPLQWRAKELTYAAELTGATALITVETSDNLNHLDMDKKIKEKVSSVKQIVSYYDLCQMIKRPCDSKFDSIVLDANEIFTICWTSGTEARPKGCPMSHNNWRCQAAMAVAGGMQPGDTLLTAGPLVNMGAIGTALVPWMISGGTIVLHHPFDPALLLQQLVQEKINWTLLVPAFTNLILKTPAAVHADLGHIRSITMGSAPPSIRSMEEFKRRWNIDIGNIWGQTEGTGIVSGVKDMPDTTLRKDLFPRYGVKGHTWSIPITQFIETKIIDPLGNKLTKDGDVGELLYRGPNTIAGYFRRPDLNKVSFDADGFFRTGDLFQIKGDKYLKFFDRIKNIIIRGGMNISALEVENMIMAHPLVQEAVVVGMPDEMLGERICAYVVPVPEQNITTESIIICMKEQQAAAYKIPDRIEIVTAIPHNPVGKVLKRDLREDIVQKLNMES